MWAAREPRTGVRRKLLVTDLTCSKHKVCRLRLDEVAVTQGQTDLTCSKHTL